MENVKINFLGYNENTLLKQVRDDFSNENGIGENLQNAISSIRRSPNTGKIDSIIAILLGMKSSDTSIKEIDNYLAIIYPNRTNRTKGTSTLVRNMVKNSVGLIQQEGTNNQSAMNIVFNKFVTLINDKYNSKKESFTIGDVYNLMNEWEQWGIGDKDPSAEKSNKKKNDVLNIFRGTTFQSESTQSQDTEEENDTVESQSPISSVNEQNYDLDENEDTPIENSTSFPKNLILYGPPGTGKTYNTVKLAVEICNGTVPDDYAEVMKQYNALVQEPNRIAFTTFHQSYGYEDFIEGIRPIMSDDKSQKTSDDKSQNNDNNGELKYQIADGIFKDFCKKANGNKGQNYVFIIDEINRGNISKIFGELITLIEETKRKGMAEAASALLPYSHELFSVPSNVYIIGTMNTADRSIALMDTALRRRFSFEEMMPDAQLLDGIEIEGINIKEMFEAINKRIEFLFDREHTIGHAFFMKLKDNGNIETLSHIFKNSVIPLLQEYFYEDYEKIRLVLGDTGKAKEY